MAQRMKVFADQPDDPSFISGIPMIERMNLLPKIIVL